MQEGVQKIAYKAYHSAYSSPTIARVIKSKRKSGKDI
jgi:hypothetical protein